MLRSPTHGLGYTRHFSADVLPSLVSPASPEFVEKKVGMDALVEELEAKLARERTGGGEKAADRMRKRGKMLPRERCDLLLSSPNVSD